MLSYAAKDTEEQVRLDPRKMSHKELAAALGKSEYESISDKAVDEMVIVRKGALKAWNKDGGEAEKAFRREVDDVAVGLGLKSKKTGSKTADSERFDAFLSSEYRKWREAQKEDGPAAPSPAERDAMLRRAMDYGDKGGTHISSNKYRYQVTPGDEFTTEGFEKDQRGHKKLEGIRPSSGSVPKATRVQGAEIGQPGGVWELQPSGKYKRVE